MYRPSSNVKVAILLVRRSLRTISIPVAVIQFFLRLGASANLDFSFFAGASRGAAEDEN